MYALAQPVFEITMPENWKDDQARFQDVVMWMRENDIRQAGSHQEMCWLSPEIRTWRYKFFRGEDAYVFWFSHEPDMIHFKMRFF